MKLYMLEDSVPVQRVTFEQSKDPAYMEKLIIKDYKRFREADRKLKEDYGFAWIAINSCLSEVNNDDNKEVAITKLKQFLDEIRECSGIDLRYERTKQNTFIVKDNEESRNKIFGRTKSLWNGRRAA